MVEVELLHGTDSVVIVGLPDATIKESRERVISALKSTDYNIVDKKIVINLASAEYKKSSPIFDFPMAIGILKRLGKIKEEIHPTTAFIGALSLDGRVQRVDGILPTLLGLGACNHPKNVDRVRLEKGRLFILFKGTGNRCLASPEASQRLGIAVD